MPQRGRYGAVSRRAPVAAAVCDRGGEVVKHSELRREMRWAGTRLVPTGFMCCPRHIDRPHPQDYALVLRPDPVPVRDPRPMFDMPPPAPPDQILDNNGLPLFDADDDFLTQGATP
jgi:hypothetical protein